MVDDQGGCEGSARRFGAELRLLVLLAACSLVVACQGAGSSPAAAERPALADSRWERTAGAARSTHGLQQTEAVRAAGKVVLIGGVDYDQTGVQALVLDADSGQWTRAAPSRLWGRFGYSAVATGDEVILWGGCCGPAGRGSRAAGAVYGIERDDWREIDPGPLVNRFQHTAVWTGREMIVWGGSDGHRPRKEGAAYNPRSGRWRRIAPAPLSARHYHAAVWTGREMIVWGGSRPLSGERQRVLSDGAAYDPWRDSWRRLAPSPFRSAPARVLGTGLEAELDAAWTGRGMIVWNGARGAMYRPRSDSWYPLPPPPPSIRHWKPSDSAIWTGAELIVWGGWAAVDAGDYISNGASYDREQHRWRVLPDAPIGGRDRHVAIWTGEAMLVWGGCCRGDRYHSDGALYRPG
jgi:hypothetical protein